MRTYTRSLFLKTNEASYEIDEIITSDGRVIKRNVVWFKMEHLAGPRLKSRSKKIYEDALANYIKERKLS